MNSTDTNKEKLREEDRKEFLRMSDDKKYSIFEGIYEKMSEFIDNQQQMEEKLKEMEEYFNKFKEFFNNKPNNRYKQTVQKYISAETGEFVYINDGLNNINFSNYVLKNNLKKILDQRGINQTWVQTKTDIKKSTFNTIVNNINKKISLEDAYKISMVLGVQITEIFPYVKDKNSLK